ncbi:MAG: amino acid adenylation domain-containing protein [Candidatus Omnitrophota bacterium]
MTQQNEKTNQNPGLAAKRQAALEKLLKGKVPVDLKAKSIPRRKVFSPVPLSFAQQRLWVLDRLVPDNSFYNVPNAIIIKGKLDIPVFERTINELIRRHESLRTVFCMENEEPVQVILPEMPYKLNVIDISHLDEAERDKEMHRLTAREASMPFDLEHGPMMRIMLLILGQDMNALAYTMHHIVSDTWSMELFTRELVMIYEAFLENRPSPLPEIPIQYADFSVWQKEWLQGEVLDRQLSYWKNILSGELPILEIPADRQRPAISSYRGKMQKVRIPEDLTLKLVELSRSQGCSMYMLVMAAFNVLLYRYSGQDDILIGSPIANRRRAELEQIIGFFANTVVIRTDLSGNPPFTQLLERVREVTSGTYDNQDLPFEKLVEELQPDRYMNHNPLFQAMFVLQNVPRQSVEIKNENTKSLEVRPFPAYSGSAKFDLWLSLSQYEDIMAGSFEYSTDLFDDDTITRIFNNLKNLLAAIVENPNQRLDDLDFISDEEKDRLINQWNNTHKEYDLQSLHHAFEVQVQKTPDRMAVFAESSHAASLQLTYRELNERADQLAFDLTQKGVGLDMIVGLKIERSVEMVIGLMGILKAGGAYLPLDPELPQDRIDYMLNDSQAVILLTKEEITKSFCPAFYKKRAAGGIKNLSYIIYTSGSTGKPKGVAVEHSGVSNRLQWMQEAYGLTGRDRVLQKTPFSFDVSVWEFFWTLLYGATLVMAKPGGHKDSAYLVETINREVITTIHFVPTMLNVFLGDPGIHTIHTLTRVICSGEALPLEYQEHFYSRFGEGVKLHNLYGPTEASVDVTFWECERNTERHTVPIGKPVSNTCILMLDRNLKMVPTGVQGELHIGGVQLARGYINRPELTAEKFVGGRLPVPGGQLPVAGNPNLPHTEDNLNLTHTENNLKNTPNLSQNKSFWSHLFSKRWAAGGNVTLYKTGDLAKWAPDGNIEYVGRLDFQVKVRGFRIELGEIESNLRDHEAVSDAAAIVREDASDSKLKKLIAYIVPETRYWQVYKQEETASDDLSQEQVTDWQSVFDDTYSKNAGQENPAFNIIGWNSSYTGEPLPAQDMRTWVDHTVERILSFNPQHIMEIGCGTGLYLFPIIPFCSHFIGTDIAKQGLNYICDSLERIRKPGWADVQLMERRADNFDGIETRSLDLIFLNSVVQYFPSADYLVEVLEKAVPKIKPGGHIFLGDIRSLPLLKTFHTSVESFRAEPDTEKETLVNRILTKMSLEQELVIDPLFFEALKKRIPAIKHADVLIKNGRYCNELSKFRYDVILHIGTGKEDLPSIQPDLVLDWKERKPNPEEIRDLLIALAKDGHEPGCMVITSVPNSRVVPDIQAQKRLAGIDEPGSGDGFDPNDFLELGHISSALPYHVSIHVSPVSGQEGTFDVVLIRRDIKAKSPHGVVRGIHPVPRVEEPIHWNTYTNNPLLVKISGKLIPELRAFLKDRIPEYMVPSHFVLLDRLPVTSNGKLDRKSLPEPTRGPVNPNEGFVEPSTETEIFLAGLWKDILNLEKVGVNQNFFELGGDSVNAIQMVSRANKKGMEISVQLLFRNQTIAELATAVAKTQHKTVKVGEETYNAFMASLDMEAILKQVPAGAEIEDIYPATPLQLHQAQFLETQDFPDPPVFLYQRRDLPMKGLLDPDELNNILQLVSERHKILRTVILWKGLKEPVQVVYKKLKFDFDFCDLSAVPDDQKVQGMYEFLKQDWNKTFVRNNSSPMRVGLFKLKEDIFLYYFTGDYMRMEGWSANSFVAEVLNFYGMVKTGVPLPPVSSNANCYKEYLHTLRVNRNREDNPAEKYYQRIFKDFSGMKPLTSIPGNRTNQSSGFGGSHFYLSPEMSHKLEQFLLEHRLNLSPVIQGTWAALIGHYLQQDRVAYGMVTTGRSTPIAGIEQMTGHSINILPVMVPVTKEKPILSYLSHIRDIQSEWMQYEYTQVDQVYKWVNIPMGQLFDHYVVIQNLASAKGDIRGKERDKDSWRRKAELMFAKMEYPMRFDVFSGYEYGFTFQYSLRHFTTPAVKGLADNLQMLIENLLENPHQTFDEWLKIIDMDKYKLYENDTPNAFVQR